MDKVEQKEREELIQRKIERRIKATTIIGFARFRDHFSSCPGRHSWDLCGHPAYYWKLKAASESKYFDKIIVWTEIKEAWKLAEQMSDKFVIKKRTIEECREPEWRIIDDLKTPDSRVSTYSLPVSTIKVSETPEFKSALIVTLAVNYPLETAKDLDRLIEKYFEDDIAELAWLVYRVEPFLWIRHPEEPQYLMPFLHFFHTRKRQSYPTLFRASGSHIYSYQWTKMGRLTYVEIPPEHGVEVHNEKDLELARFYMEKRLDGQED